MTINIQDFVNDHKIVFFELICTYITQVKDILMLIGPPSGDNDVTKIMSKYGVTISRR